MAGFDSRDADDHNLMEVEEAELSSEDEVRSGSSRDGDARYGDGAEAQSNAPVSGHDADAAIVAGFDPGDRTADSDAGKADASGGIGGGVERENGATDAFASNSANADDGGAQPAGDANAEAHGEDASAEDEESGDDFQVNGFDAGESGRAGGAQSGGDDNDDNDAYVEEEDEEDESSEDGDFDQVGDMDDDVLGNGNGVNAGEGIVESFSAEEGEDDEEEDEIGEANGDDEDDDSSDHVIKRGRQRRTSLKIPEELRDDGEYFRRSSRQRKSVSRYADDDDADDSSEPGADQDSDFEAGVADSDEEDADAGDENASDEGYEAPSRRRAAKTRRRPRGKAKPSEDDDVPMHNAHDEEESDSDGDWNSAPSKRRVGGRRAKPKRRPRGTAKSSEDDELSHTMRINARTGGAVNYAEAGDEDSDILDDEDAAAARAAKLEAASAEGGDDVDRIEQVCDYRMPDVGGEGAARTSSRDGITNIPFGDFDPNAAEFNINWTGKSFRSNTWHRQEELKLVKGFRKVSIYIANVEHRARELKQPTVSSEELEEAGILFIENREALAEFTIVDRIVAEREAEGGDTDGTEFLVKWRNLPYKDCTWEAATALTSEDDIRAIDAYRDRVQSEMEAASSSAKTKRFNPFGRDARSKFRRMATQPKYLHGEGRTLREYQLAGLNWLAFSWSNNRNVILADEMGLGKTLQTISFLGWIMYERNVPGPFLVVVPLSTIAAWVREFARWLPEMNIVCYNGNGKSRELIREHEFQPRAARSRGTGVGFHVLLTTPELAMMDIQYLEPIRWAMIAVDEAHRLKNKDSELHNSLLSLTSANRLLVTGTPLQNSVGELWALLHFLNPEQFDDLDDFEESFSFSALRDEDRVAKLHSMLRPYIIRRQKVDVEKSLPKKTYNVLRVGMTSSQQDLYRDLLTKNYAKLGMKGKGMGPKTTLRNLVMELKKCCNHPYLFDNMEDLTVKTTVETLIRASGKMILLDKLLLRLREKGNRVLVFSQMVRMLDILSDYCRMRGFQYQRLDGSMPNDARVRAVDHYNAEGSSDFVFLLSTRAGGLGINLATADTVIIFDSDWNPQNDLQAESRAHRIGQKRDVKVFRLLSKMTVEEDILERAKRKRVLEHLVIHGVEGDEQDKDGKNKFNKQDLSAILRFGAEKLFKEEPNRASKDGEGCQGDGAETGVSQTPVSAGEDAKAEERRVLEADDIDELLARAPREEDADLGAAEPSMGDSLLNAFKWADFDPIAEEEEAEAAPSKPDPSAAKDAARVISTLEEKRARDVAQAQAKQERENADLNREGDADYWERVIPANMKSKAAAEALDEKLVLGTRRRKKTKSYGTADSPELGEKRRSNRGSRELKGKKEAVYGSLSLKEGRTLCRSWRRFGDLSRVADILTDAGISDRIDEAEALKMLESALADVRRQVREANANPRPPEDVDKNVEKGPKTDATPGATGKAGKASGKAKGPPPVMVDVFGEQINGRDLIRRCDEMELLRRKIRLTTSGDTQFRLRKQIKPPAYGVTWKSKHDAMLLVGIYRHGIGNWATIAADKDLELDGKMNVPGSGTDMVGAPDSTKLMRRATALLRELTLQEKALSDAGGKQSSKSRKAKGRQSSAARGTKRDRERVGSDLSGKGKKRARVGKNEQSPVPSTRALADKLKATHRPTLKELRKISRADCDMDSGEKIRRTKECLIDIGGEITKLAKGKEKARAELWRFVHDACKTAMEGDRLAKLYDKLVGGRSRDDAPSR